MYLVTGTSYKPISDSALKEVLEPVVYNLELNKSGFYLNRTLEGFTFDFKVYGYEKNFIDYFNKVFSNTIGNIGVLLVGLKGTGKTVTAKLLAQTLGLPVININKSFGEDNSGIETFLATIDSDCVIFLDEFEKTFEMDDPTILRMMDSVYNTKYRRVFLLTSNSMDINDNLIGRPSRVRYIRKFNSLNVSIVREYLEDTLNDKSLVNTITEFTSSLSFNTIDILKVLVEDINIAGFNPEHIKDTLNLQFAAYSYVAYETNAPLNKIDCSLSKFKEQFTTHTAAEIEEYGIAEDCLVNYGGQDKESLLVVPYTVIDNRVTANKCFSHWKIEEALCGKYIIEEIDAEGYVLLRHEYNDSYTMMKIEDPTLIKYQRAFRYTL